ncbi:protein jag [Erysipelotrichaceae bacterium MTC7]|nr:protein jag [Erysipelotrichaceae bacterium MTC7]
MKTYTGKSIEEILETIATQEDVDVEDITYNIVEEKAGFLGVGKEITVEAFTKRDILDFVYDYILQFFDNMDMEIELNVEEEDDNFYKATINAANNAILIGKNGQTLQAINTVLKAAVSGTFKKRISTLVDINGYKDDRYRKVVSIATRVAKTVQQTKTDAVLDPMPNDERKAIHNHLQTFDHITTVSEGDGNQRRLKICYSED